MNQNIYCGNNLLHENLVNGTSVLGTRYSCMRKGIGRALFEPADSAYLNNYQPIDNRKIYCGNNQELPVNYDYMGNLPMCLQKGIGIGKRLKAQRGDTSQITTTVYIYIILGIIGTLIIAYVIYREIQRRKEEKRKLKRK